jgi:hypothetical protein
MSNNNNTEFDNEFPFQPLYEERTRANEEQEQLFEENNIEELFDLYETVMSRT